MKLKPRPYQRHAIDCIRETWDRGILNALDVKATGLGKALREDQRVLTPHGWVRIGRLKVGEFVTGSNGWPTRVDGVFPQGVRPMYRVSFADGAAVICDGDHLWALQVSPVDTCVRVRTTRAIRAGIKTKDAYFTPGIDEPRLSVLAPLDVPAVAYLARHITSVEPAGDAEAVCIKVAAEDGLFVTEGYVLTHNTVIFCNLIREFLGEHGNDAKALIIAHRDELIDQARKKYLEVDPDELVGVYKGARRETWARVIVASIQSCYPDRTDENGQVIRKGRIHDLPLSKIKVVVIDECHHATAQSYQDLVAAIREQSPECVVLGETATPYRGDGKGLGVFWDALLKDVREGKKRPQDIVGALSDRVGIDAGIGLGFLVPFSPLSRRIELDVNLAGVTVSRASHDFVESSLAAVMNTEDVRREVVSQWKAAAGPGAPNAPPGGRPTVFYCAGVDAAVELARVLNEEGVKTATVSGETDKALRRKINMAYQDGEIQAITNCTVYTEGWDAPRTSCVVIVRPTRSMGLFVQMIGRGTRCLGHDIEDSIRNGKHDNLLLDFTGASANGVVSQADLSHSDFVPGIDPDEDEQALQDLMEAPPDVLEQLVAAELTTDVHRAEIRGVTVYAVDLFSGGQVAWAIIDHVRVCCANIGLAVLVYPERDGSGAYTAIAMRDQAYRVIAKRTPEIDALKAASAFAVLHGNPAFLNPGPWWTKKPATERQVRQLQRDIGANIDLDRKRIAAASARGEACPPSLNLAGLPANLNQASMAQAMLWIAYLHMRAAFGASAAQQVGDLFTAQERVDKLQKRQAGQDGQRKARGAR